MLCNSGCFTQSLFVYGNFLYIYIFFKRWDGIAYLKVRVITGIWVLEKMFVHLPSEPLNLLRPNVPHFSVGLVFVCLFVCLFLKLRGHNCKADSASTVLEVGYPVIFGTVVFTCCVHRYQTKGRATAHTAGKVRVNGGGGGEGGCHVRWQILGISSQFCMAFQVVAEVGVSSLKKKKKEKKVLSFSARLCVTFCRSAELSKTV